MLLTKNLELIVENYYPLPSIIKRQRQLTFFYIKTEKAKAWKTAIGLQKVDGLKPSDYLIATAKQNIEGDK